MQRFENARQNTLFIVENVIVPETENPEALARQVIITPLITRIFGMLTAVRFDDQSACEACEVGYIVIDRQLPFEFIARQPFAAQDLPQAMFGGRRH